MVTLWNKLHQIAHYLQKKNHQNQVRVFGPHQKVKVVVSLERWITDASYDIYRHSFSISGIFCNYDILIKKYIKKLKNIWELWYPNRLLTIKLRISFERYSVVLHWVSYSVCLVEWWWLCCQIASVRSAVSWGVLS